MPILKIMCGQRVSCRCEGGVCYVIVCNIWLPGEIVWYAMVYQLLVITSSEEVNVCERCLLVNYLEPLCMYSMHGCKPRPVHASYQHLPGSMSY